jgi:catechol 2,3-dioxygenase-like lactoylglutathione lyase family enzyme
MLRRIDRVVLQVPNVASAVAYWRDVLGLSVIREALNLATLRMADGISEIVLHSDSTLPAEATFFLVDDVRDLFRQREELRLTFVSPPVSVARGYRAVVKDPFGVVLQIIDRVADQSGGVEDARSAQALFPGIEPRSEPNRDLLIALYAKIGRTADDLPYTPHFESLYEPYVATRPDPKPDRAEVWRHLLNLRKSGKLPKLGEARSNPPALRTEERAALKALLGDDLGKRDRLPYTARFDELVDEFNKALERPISPHLVWRLVATIAK